MLQSTELNAEIGDVLRLMGPHFKITDNIDACRPAWHLMQALTRYQGDPSADNLRSVRDGVVELRKHVPER